MSHAFMRGDLVAYEPHPGAQEVGVVIRVTPDWVFVRYGTSEGAKATSHHDLRLLERTRTMSDIHDCPDCHMRPGSDTAIEVGCTCPRLDNWRGHRSPHMVYVLDCQVHGFTTREGEEDDEH